MRTSSLGSAMKWAYYHFYIIIGIIIIIISSSSSSSSINISSFLNIISITIPIIILGLSRLLGGVPDVADEGAERDELLRLGITYYIIMLQYYLLCYAMLYYTIQYYTILYHASAPSSASKQTPCASTRARAYSNSKV